MLRVTESKVDFYLETNDPIIKMAYQVVPNIIEKSTIQVDLTAVFEAISDKYGIATCADLVQKAMEDVSDKYKKDA